MGKGITRRDFLRGAAAALPASSYLLAAGASGRIRLGLIGCGLRGRELIEEIRREGPGLDARIAAVCDIWKIPRERAAEEVRSSTGEAPAACRNTDELHALKGIDAVVIATADHQHAKMCVEAVKQGKDVHVEMPLAHFLDDAIEARKAVVSSGRVAQVGAWRLGDPLVAAAAETARSGRLGRIDSVDLSWNSSDPGLWRREAEVALLREADTDWKRFLLHLPTEKFDPRKEIEFRLFWPYSSGIPDQWLSRRIELVPWLTGDAFPRSCVASGGVYAFRDGRMNADHFTAVFQYPRGFQVLFRSAMKSPEDSIAEVYRFEGGDLDLRAGVLIRPGDAGKRADGAREEIRPAAGEGPAPMREFLECVRDRRTPRADIHAGFQHSVAICMAIEALNSGKRIGYDPLKEKFVGA